MAFESKKACPRRADGMCQTQELVTSSVTNMPAGDAYEPHTLIVFFPPLHKTNRQ